MRKCSKIASGWVNARIIKDYSHHPCHPLDVHVLPLPLPDCIPHLWKYLAICFDGTWTGGTHTPLIINHVVCTFFLPWLSSSSIIQKGVACPFSMLFPTNTSLEVPCICIGFKGQSDFACWIMNIPILWGELAQPFGRMLHKYSLLQSIMREAGVLDKSPSRSKD